MLVRITLVGAAILGLATAVGYGMGAFASSADAKAPSASQNIYYGRNAKSASKSSAKRMTHRKSKNAGAVGSATAATSIDSMHRTMTPDRSLSRAVSDMRRSFSHSRENAPFRNGNQGGSSRLLPAPVSRSDSRSTPTPILIRRH